MRRRHNAKHGWVCIKIAKLLVVASLGILLLKNGMNRSSRILHCYQRLMSRYPLVMNSVQSGFITAAGDVLAQKVAERKSRDLFSPLRTVRMASVGLITGPIVTIWYRVLDKLCGSNMSVKTAVSKVLIIELLFAPPAVGFVLLIDAALEEKSGKKLIEEKFFDMLFANYAYWPIASFAVFRWVPPYLRPPATSLFGLGWTAFVSWCIHNDSKTPILRK